MDGAASGRLVEVLDEACEQPAAVGRAERGLDVVPRGRLKADHIGASFPNPGDRAEGAVDVPLRIECAVGRAVAEQDAAVAFELGERLRVGDVVPLPVRDGNPDY